jgi:hypothetical protein
MRGYEDFKFDMSNAEANGIIDIDDLAGIRVQDTSANEIINIRIKDSFKKEQILPILMKYTFMVFYDKYGNGHAKITL